MDTLYFHLTIIDLKTRAHFKPIDKINNNRLIKMSKQKKKTVEGTNLILPKTAMMSQIAHGAFWNSKRMKVEVG